MGEVAGEPKEEQEALWDAGRVLELEMMWALDRIIVVLPPTLGSLACCNPRGRKESDVAERLN